ncbi:MAG: ferritin family protein [Caldisericia bacterium]|nr:ferritin family protein [Caldisericia bacterium]
MDIVEMLKKGIQSENEAKRFYYKLSLKVIDNKAKRRLIKFFKEEEKHELSLKKLLKKNFNKEYNAQESFKENPEFLSVEEDLGKDIKSVDIVKIAIKSEMNAIKFYSSLLDKIKNGRDRRIMNSLIKMEKSHEELLRREYELLKKEDYWAKPTMENLGDLRL